MVQNSLVVRLEEDPLLVAMTQSLAKEHRLAAKEARAGLAARIHLLLVTDWADL